MPMRAMPMRATEAASRRGWVRCAMSRRMTAPESRQSAERAANTHSCICQSATARMRPARITEDEGPSVVMAPMMPI